jgi:hypothetical protein
MKLEDAYTKFHEIKLFYDTIPSSKYRHADLNTLKEKYDRLQSLKDDLGHDKAYVKLVNAMSQVIAKLEKSSRLAIIPKDKIWSNLSERGMNKAIPAIMKRPGQSWPVEYKDRWGNTCHVSNGQWGVKNYRVMDVVGYMLLMKIGGDCLPKNATPIFNDLHDIQQLENQLNGGVCNILPAVSRHKIHFTDDHFRQFSGFQMSSTQIKDLLLETSRVEFKLTFPVRLKSTGSKENSHRMNYYSRFFEIGHEDLNGKNNGVVLARRYAINFNTLLGELFVNNLLAKFNDPIDMRFYLLPDSAQIFYRRALVHHDYKTPSFNLTTIAEYVGLTDQNPWNLATTIESNVLQPLIDYGYIDSYEKVGDDPKAPKYIIRRFSADSNGKSKEEVGSVKDQVGSVKDVVGSVKSETR